MVTVLKFVLLGPFLLAWFTLCVCIGAFGHMGIYAYSRLAGWNDEDAYQRGYPWVDRWMDRAVFLKGDK